MTWLHKHSLMYKYGFKNICSHLLLSLNLGKTLVEKGHTVFYSFIPLMALCSILAIGSRHIELAFLISLDVLSKF